MDHLRLTLKPGRSAELRLEAKMMRSNIRLETDLRTRWQGSLVSSAQPGTFAAAPRLLELARSSG